jgi:hypothetical protein
MKFSYISLTLLVAVVSAQPFHARTGYSALAMRQNNAAAQEQPQAQAKQAQLAANTQKAAGGNCEGRPRGPERAAGRPERATGRCPGYAATERSVDRAAGCPGDPSIE